MLESSWAMITQFRSSTRSNPPITLRPCASANVAVPPSPVATALVVAAFSTVSRSAPAASIAFSSATFDMSRESKTSRCCASTVTTSVPVSSSGLSRFLSTVASRSATIAPVACPAGSTTGAAMIHWELIAALGQRRDDGVSGQCGVEPVLAGRVEDGSGTAGSEHLAGRIGRLEQRVVAEILVGRGKQRAEVVVVQVRRALVGQHGHGLALLVDEVLEPQGHRPGQRLALALTGCRQAR